ncbi:MAG: hypothetical protein Q8L39_05970 [Burkholderiales bacterium]|nr:hypothetical protein [Burkholderiales bacterium]
MDSLCVPVKSWMPIRTPVYGYQERFPAYAEARDKFISQLPLAIQAGYQNIGSVTAALGEPASDIVEDLASRNIIVSAGFVEYIEVNASVTIDVAELVRINEGKQFDEPMLIGIAAYEMSSALETILILSELAFPGAIDTTDGLTVVDAGRQPFKSKGAYWAMLFPEDSDPLWPPLRQLELGKIVEWAKKTSFFSSGLASTRVERALAAYTHVIGLTWHRDGEVLFRAMQGLEAFYCDGIGDLRKQLSDKAAMWLGKWADKKNVVGHLYDLRSEFVHGSARLEYWVSHADAWEEDEKHMHRFSHGVMFAIRLLLATLQRCIVEDVTHVQWAYSVETRG